MTFTGPAGPIPSMIGASGADRAAGAAVVDRVLTVEMFGVPIGAPNAGGA